MIIYIIDARGRGRLPGYHRKYEIAEKRMLRAAAKYGGAAMTACCSICGKKMEPVNAGKHTCKREESVAVGTLEWL